MHRNRFLELDTNPFDDNKARWDNNFHRYVTLPDYFKERTGYDLVIEFKSSLNPAAEGLRFLDDISDKSNDIVFSTANLKDRKNSIRIKEYRSAKDHDIRDMLIEAQIVYGRAALETGIDMIGDEHGRNYETGAVIKFNWQTYDDLNAQARRKFEATELMYRGIYMYSIKDEDYRSGY